MPWSWTSSLQSNGKINFCCWSCCVCSLLLQKLGQTKTAPITALSPATSVTLDRLHPSLGLSFCICKLGSGGSRVRWGNCPGFFWFWEFENSEDALQEGCDLCHRCAGEKQLCENQFSLVNRVFLKAIQGEKLEQTLLEGLLWGGMHFVQTWFHLSPHIKLYLPCKCIICPIFKKKNCDILFHKENNCMLQRNMWGKKDVKGKINHSSHRYLLNTHYVPITIQRKLGFQPVFKYI